MLKKSSEKESQLDEEGGYYTPEEMKTLLKYAQCASSVSQALEHILQVENW